MKRFLSACMAVCLIFAIQTVVAAADNGFIVVGNYTGSKTPYGFETDDALIFCNGEIIDEVTEENFEEMYPGSAIYVPIFTENANGEFSQATDKNIKNDKVEVSYKATRGSQHVVDVTIVDGKKEKIADLPAGAYAKIKLVDGYSGSGISRVEVKAVLSVNKVSYQESEIELACVLTNRAVDIKENSVYGAQVSTRFEVDRRYNGEATFDMGGGVRYTARVRESREYVINYSSLPDGNISDMYPGAYLQFHNFRGDEDAFESIGRLEIPIDSKKFKAEDGQPRVYAYEVSGNTLVAFGSDAASYSATTGKLTIRAQTLGEYVLSNQSLLKQVETGNDNTFQSGYASVPSGTGGESANSANSADVIPASPAIPQPTVQAAGANTSTGINASNVSTENPLTGVTPLLAMAVLTAVISGGLGVFLWRKRRLGR